MKYLYLTAALCAASPALCQPLGAGGDQDYGSAPGATGGGPRGPLPLYDAPAAPQRAWPELAPYPRTTASPPPAYAPVDLAEQKLREMELETRRLSQEFSQKLLRDALQRQPAR